MKNRIIISSALALSVGWAVKAHATTIQVPLQCLPQETVIARYVQDGKHWQPLAVVSTGAESQIVLITDTRDKETHVWLVIDKVMCYIEGGQLSRLNVEAVGLKKGML